MAEPITVALPFAYQDDWVGGLYYARNVVAALALLPAEKRPRLVVIGDEKAADFLRAETGYPGLQRVAPEAVHRERRWSLNAFKRLPTASEFAVDVVLLGSAPGLEARAIQWIPDFQEERFPDFFSAKELKARRKRNAKWLARHRHVMVSSEDVRGDLERFWGRFQNRAHVVPFASFVDAEAAKADAAVLREKYGLPPRYFICCNQLWRHKNHTLILRALADLGTDSGTPPVVMTGREHDYRDRAYAPSVRAMAEELALGERVRFLGMLPREDQLGLIAGAIAVVQPSLCEGWSTVVEDAKALGKHVLASDIAVHREQLDMNADFFGTTDHERLAELLRRYAEDDPAGAPLDYDACKRRFGARLMDTIVEVDADFTARGVPRLRAVPASTPALPA